MTVFRASNQWRCKEFVQIPLLRNFSAPSATDPDPPTLESQQPHFNGPQS
jgi:hypothetical protein